MPGKTRGFSSSPTVRQKKNIHHVRRSVYAVNNPRLSHLGRRPPVRAQAAGSGAEIPLGADRRGNSAQAGSPAGTSQGKQPKRRQRRKKRGCFEEGPRSAGAATPADRLGPTVCTRGAIAAQTGSKIAMPPRRQPVLLRGYPRPPLSEWTAGCCSYRCRESPPGRGSG